MCFVAVSIILSLWSRRQRERPCRFVRRRPQFGHQIDIEETVANCLKAVHGWRRTGQAKSLALCASTGRILCRLPCPCFFPGLCHVLLHRPAGRRTWARNTPSGYERTAIFCNHANSAVCQALFYSDIWLIAILTVLSAGILRCSPDYCDWNRIITQIVRLCRKNCDLICAYSSDITVILTELRIKLNLWLLYYGYAENIIILTVFSIYEFYIDLCVYIGVYIERR